MGGVSELMLHLQKISHLRRARNEKLYQFHSVHNGGFSQARGKRHPPSFTCCSVGGLYVGPQFHTCPSSPHWGASASTHSGSPRGPRSQGTPEGKGLGSQKMLWSSFWKKMWGQSQEAQGNYFPTTLVLKPKDRGTHGCWADRSITSKLATHAFVVAPWGKSDLFIPSKNRSERLCHRWVQASLTRAACFGSLRTDGDSSGSTAGLPVLVVALQTGRVQGQDASITPPLWGWVPPV